MVNLVIFLLVQSNFLTKATEGENLSLQFQKEKAHHGRKTQQQTGKRKQQELEAVWLHCFQIKQRARSGVGFKASRPTFNELLPPARFHYLPKPAGEQVYKHVNLIRDTLYSNHNSGEQHTHPKVSFVLYASSWKETLGTRKYSA